jgi:hypothetical protein
MEGNHVSTERKAGASASLNKTITEIVEFIGNDDEQTKGEKLRTTLHQKIGDLAQMWYRRGFKRGHIESHKHFKASDTVPTKLEFECRRKLSPSQERDIVLKSEIKSKHKKPKGTAQKKRP